MSRNVQKYSKEVYLRASEAQQCRVHSAVVLPLFTAGDRGTSLGIIEVVQTRQDMSFADIVTHLAQALEVRPRRPPPLPRPQNLTPRITPIVQTWLETLFVDMSTHPAWALDNEFQSHALDRVGCSM